MEQQQRAFAVGDRVLWSTTGLPENGTPGEILKIVDIDGVVWELRVYALKLSTGGTVAAREEEVLRA